MLRPRGNREKHQERGNDATARTDPSMPRLLLFLVLMLFSLRGRRIAASGQRLDPGDRLFPLHELRPVRQFIVDQGLQPAQRGDLLDLPLR